MIYRILIFNKHWVSSLQLARRPLVEVKLLEGRRLLHFGTELEGTVVLASSLQVVAVEFDDRVVVSSIVGL